MICFSHVGTETNWFYFSVKRKKLKMKKEGMFPVFWFSNTTVCKMPFSAPYPQPLQASLWYLCVDSANIVVFRDWWIYGVWLSWKQSQIGERQLECDHHRELVPVVWCQLFPLGRLVWRSIEIGDLAPLLHISSPLSPVNKIVTYWVAIK